MAFIASDGSLQQSKPLGLNRIVDFFWAVVTFFILFFRGLFHMDEPSTKGQYGNSRGNAPAWPRRRMGGLSGTSGVAPPPCAPGGG